MKFYIVDENGVTHQELDEKDLDPSLDEEETGDYPPVHDAAPGMMSPGYTGPGPGYSDRMLTQFTEIEIPDNRPVLQRLYALFGPLARHIALGNMPNQEEEIRYRRHVQHITRTALMDDDIRETIDPLDLAQINMISERIGSKSSLWSGDRLNERRLWQTTIQRIGQEQGSTGQEPPRSWFAGLTGKGKR